MVKTKTITMLVAAVSLLTLGFATVVQAHTADSIDEAKELAATKDLPIVLDFYADWCAPCQAFLKATKEDAALQAALGQVVLVKLNAEAEANKGLVEEYAVYGYPSFVMTSATGEVMDRWRGFESTSDWVASLEGTLADPTTLAQKRARFESDPNLTDALTLARNSSATGDNQAAIDFFSHAKQLDPQPTSQYDTKIFLAKAYGSKKGQFSLDQVTAAADAVLACEGRVLHDVMTVGTVMKKVAEGFNQNERMIPYLTAALEASEGSSDPEVLETRNGLKVEHALYVEKDKAKAVALRKEMLPEGWEEEANQLNAFAWWCFQNDVNLVEAEGLARRAVSLAENDASKANILDTVAEICNARGNCFESVALIQQAIELNPDSEYLQSQLEKFQTLLAEAG